jgi:hypothetical protein
VKQLWRRGSEGEDPYNIGTPPFPVYREGFEGSLDSFFKQSLRLPKYLLTKIDVRWNVYPATINFNKKLISSKRMF